MNSRKEFEKNMHFLREGFEKNLVRINRSNLKTIKGLKNARLTPNNRANLISVDEGARSIANSFSMMQAYKVKSNEYGEK